MKPVQLAAEQELAMKVLLSGSSVFLTGKAGAGKSTLIEAFKNRTIGSYIVVAPTGKAALNVKGSTIHNQFSMPTSVNPFKTEPGRLRSISDDKKRLLERVEVIIVDEVSMVRADVLEAMDQRMKFTRNNRLPFGGVQMIFVGDFYQLPPVVLEKDKAALGDNVYAFQSPAWAELAPKFIELNDVHRQKDGLFLSALNKIRVGDKSAIEEINKMVREPRDSAVGITFTNQKASEINDRMLASLPGRSKHFIAKQKSGGVPGITVAEDLELKIGAQVITVVNAANGDYVNGSVGTVVGMAAHAIQVKLADSKRVVDVEPYIWDNMAWALNKKGETVLKSTGKFEQFPVLLAWAMTSHKLQGESIDVGHLTRGYGAFAHGQTYVALSRLRSEDGLSLDTPLQPKDVIVDTKVMQFMAEMRKLNASNIVTPVSAPVIERDEIIAAKETIVAKNETLLPLVAKDLTTANPKESQPDPNEYKNVIRLMHELVKQVTSLKSELVEVKLELAEVKSMFKKARSPSP